MKSVFTFFKHSLNFGLSSVLTQVIGFLLLPLYTRYLTPEDYGILDLASVIGLFLAPIMKLGLPGAVTRFYFDYEEGEQRMNDFIFTVFSLVISISIIIGLIAGVIFYFFSSFIVGNLDFYPFIFFSIFIALFNSNIQVQRKLIQNRLQSRLNLTLQLSFGFLNIGLTFIFVVLLDMGAFGSILASTITACVFFLQSVFYLFPNLRGRINFKLSLQIVKYGLGVVPHHLALNATPILTRSILLSVGSIGALGVYSVAYRFITPLIVGATALNSVFVPAYNKCRKEGGKSLNETVLNFLKLAVTLYILFVFLAPRIMLLVLPTEYHNAIDLAPILSLYFIFRIVYLLNASEIFYSKKTKYVSLITLLSLLSSLIFCFLFVEAFGVLALSWSVVINGLVSALVSYTFKAKTVNEVDQLSFKYGLWFTLLLLTCSLIAYFFNLWLGVF